MVVQWLKLHIFSAVAQVQSLVRELGSHKSCGMAKKKSSQKMPAVVIKVKCHDVCSLLLNGTVQTQNQKACCT